MKKDWIREYFSIPNLMGYFRILLIPLYLVVYFNAAGQQEYLFAAAIIGISGITDFFDGKIARRYHMITEWGKILDPAADKLTIGAVVLSLAFRYQLMRYVLLLYIAKEGFMVIMGAVMLKKGQRMDGAQWYGKICTAYTYFMIFILLFQPDMNEYAVNLLMIICLAVMLFTFIRYIVFYIKMWKAR